MMAMRMRMRMRTRTTVTIMNAAMPLYRVCDKLKQVLFELICYNSFLVCVASKMN
jgi:hypothetical protein